MLIEKIISKFKKEQETVEAYYLEADREFCDDRSDEMIWFAEHTDTIGVSPAKPGKILFVYRTKEMRDEAFKLAKERYNNAFSFIDKTISVIKSDVDEYDAKHEFAK